MQYNHWVRARTALSRARAHAPAAALAGASFFLFRRHMAAKRAGSPSSDTKPGAGSPASDTRPGSGSACFADELLPAAGTAGAGDRHAPGSGVLPQSTADTYLPVHAATAATAAVAAAAADPGVWAGPAGAAVASGQSQEPSQPLRQGLLPDQAQAAQVSMLYSSMPHAFVGCSLPWPGLPGRHVPTAVLPLCRHLFAPVAQDLLASASSAATPSVGEGMLPPQSLSASTGATPRHSTLGSAGSLARCVDHDSAACRYVAGIPASAAFRQCLPHMRSGPGGLHARHPAAPGLHPCYAALKPPASCCPRMCC